MCLLPRVAVPALATLFLMPFAYAQSQADRTVLDGVFTEAQAGRGEMQFAMNCAKCHEGADVDGPPLTGDPFIDRWREDTLEGLFSFIRTRMPRDNPAKLSEAVYRDILAFLLAANDYPAGKSELGADSI
ncbi:MAG TPA: cytochrome c, partial [Terracidiphilus sp.]